jgi:hypothetical protein
MRPRILLATGIMLIAAQAFSHHSFTATYDENETVEIEGQVVQFMFRNPHAWVHVLVENESGETERWGVEWGGAGQLGRQGVRRDTIKPGDHVVITGPPGRNADEHRMLMRTLYRPSDGFGWGQREGEEFN